MRVNAAGRKSMNLLRFIPLVLAGIRCSGVNLAWIIMSAIRCASSGRVYANTMERVRMATGDIWSQRAFRTHGFVCEGNHGNYQRAEMITLVNGAHWSREYFDDNGFRCDYSGDAWPNSERVDMADGHVMAKATFARHGFTCRSCERKLLLSDRYGRAVTGEQPQCVRCHTDAVTSTLANDPSNRQQRNERTEEHDHE